MSQAKLDRLVGRGLSKAASRLGVPFSVFRAVDQTSPLAGVPAGSVNLAYTSGTAFDFRDALPPSKPYVHLLCDASSLLAGDYLVGTETLFVLRKDPLRPASGVLCNVLLSVLQAPATPQPGTNGYGGYTSDSSAIVADDWPASLLLKNRTEADPTRLPSDTRSAYYCALLPNIPGVSIRAGMFLKDSAGALYRIASAQGSAFGWIINAALQTN